MSIACRDLNKLQPEFKKKVELFMKEAEPLGVFITETFRSSARQLELFKAGKSKVVRSLHQEGLAIDIGFKGEYLYPKDFSLWRRVGDIGKKYGMDWGYDMWTWDMCHFQDNGKPLGASPSWIDDYEKLARDAGIRTDVRESLDGKLVAHLVGIVDKLIEYKRKNS